MRIYILVLSLLFVSQQAFAQKFLIYSGDEIEISGKIIKQGDTINVKDVNNKKQGIWIIYNKKTQKKVSEGKFENSKKQGVWKNYYTNGKLKSALTYVNNRTNGYAQVYYENGKLMEEGIWKGDKWVGEYKFYYENGNPSYEWKYNEKGERTGEQKYFHENGKIKIAGNWKEGKEQGVVTEYYEDGSIKSEKTFKDGKFDETTVKVFEKNEVADNNENKNNSNNNENSGNQTKKDTAKVVDNDKLKIVKTNDVFDGNGYHVLYNTKHTTKTEKKIDREGLFRNGKLITGKRYIYNEAGEVVRTVEYKDGKKIYDSKDEEENNSDNKQ